MGFSDLFIKKTEQEQAGHSDFDPNMFMDAKTEEKNGTNLSESILSTEAESNTSIFKVAEIRNNLPSTLPLDVMKSTVKVMLKSFGVSVEEVVSDGESRLEQLRYSYSNDLDAFQDRTTARNAQIEDFKKKISDLQAQISEDTANMDAESASVNETEKTIVELVNFIK